MPDEDNKLFSLPKGWAWAELGDICRAPQYGWTTSAVDTGKIRLLRTTDITSGKIDWNSVPFCKEEPPDIKKYLLRDGDIVISRAGSIGYSLLILEPKQVVFASYLIRFVPLLISKEFLAYFLKSPYYWMSISAKSLGIAIPNVNASKLKQIRTPIPPLPEQHRIVAKIEELFTKLDAGVEALKKMRAQIKRYRQAVLKNAFEGKLTQEWREAHKDELEPATVLLERIRDERKKNSKGKNKILPSIDSSDLPELPERWAWSYLPELGELDRGVSKHRPRNDHRLFGGNYPFIQTGEIRNSKGIIKTFVKTYNEFGLKQSRLWPTNTLCITIAANIAETAILEIQACFPDSIVGFIADNRIVNSRYVHYFFRTIKSKLESYASATAQKNINLETLKAIIVPLAHPGEQDQIVSEIERLFSMADEIEKAVDQGLKQAERLRQSILKKAFEGKLVPQDPNDEPAERLLQRIQAEKAKQNAEKKLKKGIKTSKAPRQKGLFKNGQ